MITRSLPDSSSLLALTLAVAPSVLIVVSGFVLTVLKEANFSVMLLPIVFLTVSLNLIYFARMIRPNIPYHITTAILTKTFKKMTKTGAHPKLYKVTKSAPSDRKTKAGYVTKRMQTSFKISRRFSYPSLKGL